MKKFAIATLTISLFTLPLLGQQPKKKLYIERCDAAAPQPWWQEAGLGDVGQGVKARLTHDLVTNGTFEIVESQVFADAVVRCSVIHFGFEQKRSRFGGLAGVGGLVGAVTGAPTGVVTGAIVASTVDIGKEQGKGQVRLSARLVNPEKEAVIGSFEAEGVSKKSGLLLGGLGQVAISSETFYNTALGEATGEAVKDLAAELVKADRKITVRKIEIRGKVAFVDGIRVVLNIGSSHGVQVGDALHVSAVRNTIKDPDNGKVLKEEIEALGQIRIEQVDEGSSTGTASVTGLQVGNLVTKK
jgi:curli biogenesis system outer membrane secretion channel CsgG